MLYITVYENLNDNHVTYYRTANVQLTLSYHSVQFKLDIGAAIAEPGNFLIDTPDSGSHTGKHLDLLAMYM
jgi:hypothetical protein